MSPQWPKLLANETLYQLSYTPNRLINGNNYRVKKIRSKIKTNALRLGSSASRVAHRKLVSGNAGGSFGTGRRAFNPASVLPDNRPAHLPQILRQFFLFHPTEAYAQTLIFGPTDSYKSFVHDKTEL